MAGCVCESRRRLRSSCDRLEGDGGVKDILDLKLDRPLITRVSKPGFFVSHCLKPQQDDTEVALANSV